MDATGKQWPNLAGYAGLVKGRFFSRRLWIIGGVDTLAVGLAIGALKVVGSMIVGGIIPEVTPPAAAETPQVASVIEQPVPAILGHERIFLAAAPDLPALLAEPLATESRFGVTIDAPASGRLGFEDAGDDPGSAAASSPPAPEEPTPPIEEEQPQEPTLLAAISPPLPKIVDIALRGAELSAGQALDDLLPDGLGSAVASIDQLQVGVRARIAVGPQATIQQSTTVALNFDTAAPVVAGAGNAVGAAVGTTANAAGTTANTVGSTVGATVGTVSSVALVAGGLL